MRIWLDAHVPPGLAPWIEQRFGVEAVAIRDLGLLHAKDVEIFFAAKSADATVMTKDHDFIVLLERHGPPPDVLWLTGGNTTAARLREVLDLRLEAALGLVSAGEALVEINCSRLLPGGGA